jgi:hypothetical protein
MMWGRMASCAPVGNRRYAARFHSSKRVANPLQVANLPHRKATRSQHCEQGFYDVPNSR